MSVVVEFRLEMFKTFLSMHDILVCHTDVKHNELQALEGYMTICILFLLNFQFAGRFHMT